MKYVYLLLCLMLCGSASFAQRQDTFPQNPNDFLSSFATFMTSSGNKVLKEVFEPFQTVFSSGGYSDEEREMIIRTTNSMLANRMTNMPYFKLYLEGLDLVKTNDENGVLFKRWHTWLDGFLADEERSNQEFKNLIDLSIRFFSTNTLRSSNAGTSWKALNPEFHLIYPNKEPMIEWKETDLMAYRKNDTMRITQSKGVYDLFNSVWIGEKGRVDWDSTGLGDGIYAELGSYQLDLKKSFYDVDSVKFYCPKFFGGKQFRVVFRIR